LKKGTGTQFPNIYKFNAELYATEPVKIKPYNGLPFNNPGINK